jgi:hypothetical protein
MSKQEPQVPKFDMDPGAFNAALFEAYKGTCDCAVCRILREAVKNVVHKYLPDGK